MSNENITPGIEQSAGHDQEEFVQPDTPELTFPPAVAAALAAPTSASASVRDEEFVIADQQPEVAGENATTSIVEDEVEQTDDEVPAKPSAPYRHHDLDESYSKQARDRYTEAAEDIKNKKRPALNHDYVAVPVPSTTLEVDIGVVSPALETANAASLVPERVVAALAVASRTHYVSPVDDFVDRDERMPPPDSINNKDREWSHHLEHHDSQTKVFSGRRKAADLSRLATLAPDQITAAIAEARGIYTKYVQRLPASGFCIVLRTPDPTRLSAFMWDISNAKIELGRATLGAAFSNTSVYVDEALMRLAYDCIDEHSLNRSAAGGEFTFADFLQVVQQADRDAVYAGLLAALFPNGIDVWRTCVADLTKCQHQFNERYTSRHMYMFDRKRLTQKQVSQLRRANRNSVSPTDLEHYQKDFADVIRRVEIAKSVYLELGPSNMADYIETGTRWVNAIDDHYTALLQDDPKDRERRIEEHANLEWLMRYRHFVKAVVVEQGDGEPIRREDSEAIDAILKQHSQLEDVRYKVAQAVSEVIEASRVGVFGIPTFRCPSCNSMQPSSGGFGDLMDIIALNPVDFFLRAAAQLNAQNLRTR